MFLRQCWYVFDWDTALEPDGAPIGRVLLNEPIVVWRDADGDVFALEDRCPHRHAPLSMGRVEDGGLRCMYHGLKLANGGRCVAMPLMKEPPALSARSYPVVVKNNWIWIWMGHPDRADRDLIPTAYGLNDPNAPMRHDSIVYKAHFQLIHDNLCDLSHLDFVHANTLKPATGADWSLTMPRVTQGERSITIQRWFPGALLPGTEGTTVDAWSSYDFCVPGIFIMRGARYPAGTAERCNGQEPTGVEPLMRNIEQQAVTPISERHSAYHFATGLIGSTSEMTARLASRMDVVMAAFGEDRAIIEAQQRIWDLTPPDKKMAFLPQDKAPQMMRRLLNRLVQQEQADAQRVSQ